MKIAIATNDKKNISETHFGDSQYFIIYEVNSDNLKKINTVNNIFIDIDETTKHGSDQKKESVVSLFDKDINFIVASQKSPNFKKIKKNTKIIPIVSKIKLLKEIEEYFVENYENFSNLIDNSESQIDDNFLVID